MKRIPFQESELQIVGKYLLEAPDGQMNREVPKYNTPITPRENTRLMLKGEKPLWVPNIATEMVGMKPPIIPDVSARQDGGIDWFGIDWQFEPKSNAAMVRPGTRRLSDITEWEKEIVWPDFNEIDWQAVYDNTYKDTLSDDLFKFFIIFNGLFERLADLTSFSDAFEYLITEPEALNAFFSKLADWHVEFINIIAKYFKPDMILFHDDMGSQRAPFFSPEMYDEIMVPHYQKITKAAHDNDMFIVLHSCGNVATHLPGFIKAGFDGWQGQEGPTDKAALMKEYGDKLSQYGVFRMPADTPNDEAVKIMHNLIDTVGATGRYMTRFEDFKKDRDINLAEELYRYSRIKYQDL